jgi:hypothetical protein
MPRKKKKVELTEQEQRDQRFMALFATPLGEEVLEDLRKHTIEKNPIPGQAADGMAMFGLMTLKVGECNLYRWIVGRIRQGEASCQNRS